MTKRFSGRIRRWLYLLAFLLASLGALTVLPAHLAVGPAVALDDAPAWVLSSGMAGTRDNETLYWRGRGPGMHTASRVAPAPRNAEFLALHACMRRAAAPNGAALFLASENSGALDFNRHYFASQISRLPQGECATDLFPRRDGDGDAIVQLAIFEPDARVAIDSVTLTPMQENPQWRLLRRVMLPLGIGLVLYLFLPYLLMTPRLLGLGGVAAVVAILFGCCVGVSLKADIYALISGGRQIVVEQDLASMLLSPFPLGGFSLFTYLHGVFFATACVLLETLRRGAWLDLLLLGAASETLQIWVPGRGPGVSDMLVDWAGVAAGLTLVLVFRSAQRVRLFLQHQRIDKDTAGL